MPKADCVGCLIIGDALMDNREYLDLSVHEIKNILSAISGYSEFISNKMVAGDKVLEFAERIRGLSDILAGYADRKYKYDLMHNNLYKASFENISVSRQLENAEDGFINHGLRPMRFLIACSPEIEIYADAMLIEELFAELMENAAKYSSDENLAEISVQKLEREVIISVRNRSEEIMEEELSRLTEPYFRIDKAASRKMGGQGFGLAIVYEIMKLHDGEINIAYENGYFTAELYFHSA